MPSPRETETEVMVTAWCHLGESERAQRIVDAGVDRGAVVTPHPAMRSGEVIISHPPNLLPWNVAWRDFLSRSESMPLPEILAEKDRLDVEYRRLLNVA